jgi:pimeloyl-ACP methyl ester carboxylesterase
VIFCHGFPELAYSWRRQLADFTAAGRWAAAPDQRGYGLTGGPDAVEAYDLEHLTDDLIGLLDHLGAETAIWCGHDWGGAVVWQMPLRFPERTAGVIALNTPFTPRAPVDPIEVLRARFGEDMYMVHFQKPGEADSILNADVRKTMEFFMRRPPEGARASAGLAGGEKGLSRQTFALVKMLEGYDPASDPRRPVLSEEALEVFVAAFAKTGFTGPINWYRNITRNWARSAHLPQSISQPCLMITAELDAVLPPSAAEGMDAYIADLETVMIRGSGHWTQQEKPEETSRMILDWISRRF